MELIKLLTQHPTIIDTILRYLDTEDKRRLFFSAKSIQQQLQRYKQLDDIAATAELEYMFFYFPRLSLTKCCLKRTCKRQYFDKRHVVRKIVNSNGIKLKCNQCGMYFFNVHDETEFQNCAAHKDYYYTKGQLVIKMKHFDPIGRPWTDKASYQPSQQEKALCYCDTCEKFLYYNKIQEGYKTITCLKCLKQQFHQDRQNNSIIINNVYFEGVKGFYVPNATFSALQV